MMSNWSLILDAVQSKVKSDFGIPVVVNGENIQPSNNFIFIKPLNTELVESFSSMKTYNYITQIDLNMLANEENPDEMESVFNHLQQMEDLFSKNPTLLLANNKKAFNVEFTSAQLDPEPGDYYTVRWELNVMYSFPLGVVVEEQPPVDDIVDDTDDTDDTGDTDDVLIGDSNLDGNVNVTDIVALVQFIMSGYPNTLDGWNDFIENNSNVDMNDDGEINVTDIVQIVNQILS